MKLGLISYQSGYRGKGQAENAPSPWVSLTTTHRGKALLQVNGRDAFLHAAIGTCVSMRFTRLRIVSAVAVWVKLP